MARSGARQARENSAGVSRVLIVGGSPEAPTPALVRTLVSGSDAVVAVDRGLDALLAAGLSCDLFCGDADSVSVRGAGLVRASERDAGTSNAPFEVERYDPHKDYSDLTLAFRALDARWPGAACVCTGLTGGRPDHFLGVLGSLAARRQMIELAEEGFSGRILPGGSAWEIEGAATRTFSFIPLTSEAVVSESGMRWTLDKKRVPCLSDLGISNVIEADSASITCHEGAIAAWLFT